MSYVLDSHIPSADAIARLMAPHVEAVIHDLLQGRIHYIINCFSKRRVGDPSLTDTQDIDLSATVIGPYAKTNWDGRRLKSVSTVIRDASGAPVGLMCINYDVEAFAQVLKELAGMVTLPAPVASATQLFASDWRETINDHVGAFLAARKKTFAGLMANDVNALIAVLDGAGVFNIRNATTYVADIIGCSRATLYNRLKYVRTQENDHAAPDA